MKSQSWVPGFVALLLLAGCGGGGGSNQCTSRDPSGPAPCSSATRTCYVSPNGSDSNNGSAPDPARAFRTIDKALDVIQDNYTISVLPGTYTGGISTDREGRCAPQALSLVAQSETSPVVIDARNAAGVAGIRLSNGDNSVIDGFTVINSPGSGILVKSQSDGLQVRNCHIRANGSDGIHVQDSSNVTIFNNLIYGNNGIGIALVGSSGSPEGTLINNTVAYNVGRGIEIGRSDGASGGALTRNNIVQSNDGVRGENIKVFDNSIGGYSGDFNLVFPPKYIPPNGITGSHDVALDARFDGASAGAIVEAFRLRATSPALDSGQSSGDVTGFVPFLLTRSTTTNNSLDRVPIDIGYHFAIGN